MLARSERRASTGSANGDRKLDSDSRPRQGDRPLHERAIDDVAPEAPERGHRSVYLRVIVSEPLLPSYEPTTCSFLLWPMERSTRSSASATSRRSGAFPRSTATSWPSETSND